MGVIGLSIAKAFPEAEVVLRDRDSLAVAFTEHNRILNKLKGVTAWKDPATGEERRARPAPRVEWGLLGDGREGGRESDFDFVLSNLPAKAGAPVLASFFARLSGRLSASPGGCGAGGAMALLAPGGRAAVVVVKPLAGAAAGWIAEAGLVVVAHESGSGHDVYVVELAPAAASGVAPASGTPGSEAREHESSAHERAPAADLGPLAPPPPYFRGESRFKLADLAYRAQGFWGLPEFDTPGYGSSVVAEVLGRIFPDGGAAPSSCPKVLLVEPGVGHAAIWVAKELRPSLIAAVSRDALSLEATAANLSALQLRAGPEYLPFDALGVEGLEPSAFEPSKPSAFDLIVERPVIVPERDWTAPAWERAGGLLRPGGIYLACSSPTESARLEKRRPSAGAARWSLLCRKRKKGFVAAAWRLG